MSELSTNVGAGGGPVHRPGGSVREGNAGELSGNPVRGSATGDVVSGTVSDASVGPVTEHQAVTGSGAMTDASAGAVTKDINRPLGQRISQPLREFGPLQEQLRAIQPLPRMTPLPSEQQAQEEAAARAAAESAAAQEEVEFPEAPAAEEGEATASAEPEEASGAPSAAPEAAEAPVAAAPEPADADTEDAEAQLPPAAPVEPEAEGSAAEAAPEVQDTPPPPGAEAPQ